MARKPNYAFERNKRAEAKAAKREAKRQAKLAGKSRVTDAEISDEDTGQSHDDRQHDTRNRPGSSTSPEGC